MREGPLSARDAGSRQDQENSGVPLLHWQPADQTFNPRLQRGDKSPQEYLGMGELQLWALSGFVYRGGLAGLGTLPLTMSEVTVGPQTNPILFSGPASSTHSAFKAF